MAPPAPRPLVVGLGLAYAVVLGLLVLTPISDRLGDLTVAIATRWDAHSLPGRMTAARVEALLNVALFVPVGLLVALSLRRWWVAIVVCLLVSAGIELLQELPVLQRHSSVRDLVTNTTGGAIGVAVARVGLLLARPGGGPHGRGADRAH